MRIAQQGQMRRKTARIEREPGSGQTLPELPGEGGKGQRRLAAAGPDDPVVAPAAKSVQAQSEGFCADPGRRLMQAIDARGGDVADEGQRQMEAFRPHDAAAAQGVCL